MCHYKIGCCKTPLLQHDCIVRAPFFLGIFSSPHALEAKPVNNLSYAQHFCEGEGQREDKKYIYKKRKERNDVEKERKKILSGVCEMCRPRGEEKREEEKKRE
jgi:hypothetical protein